MAAIFPFLVTILAGVALAVQPPVNATLARGGSVILAALISFAVGTAILFGIWATLDRAPTGGLKEVPWWAWTGGAYGVVFVSAAAFAAPRLGLASMLTIAIASQLVAALVIDHFGLIRLAQTPLTPLRALGVLLVLAGVVLVRRG